MTTPSKVVNPRYDLWFRWDHVPPSVNRLYFHKGGRQVLTREGLAFKTRLISSRGGLETLDLMYFQKLPDQEYFLEIWICLHPERLYNKNYLKDKRVKSPFRDIDASNIIKVLEDAIAELVGIRDRNNFSVLVHKRPVDADVSEGVIVHLAPLDMDNDPWPQPT